MRASDAIPPHAETLKLLKRRGKTGGRGRRQLPKECLICGRSPAVKSHLWPRALSHDLRRGDKHLVSGQAGRDGIEFLQSGRWRRILCTEHEDALKVFDDYGVRFVRRARERRSDNFKVPNPNPLLLKKFVLAIVWRFDAGWRVAGLPSDLGPFEPKVRETLFGRSDLEAPVIFIQSNIVAEGAQIEIAMEPTKARVRDATVWKFGFGSIECLVKISNRPWPPEWEIADASRQKEPTILVSPPHEITDLAAYRPLLQQMQIFRPKQKLHSQRK